MSEKNINESIKNLIAQEEQLVRGIAMQIVDMNNLPLKLALRAMGLDAIKHTEYLRGAQEIIQDSPKAETEEEYHRNEEHIQQQIQREEKIINQLDNLKEQINEQKIAIILDIIKQDHTRNIQTLKGIPTINASKDACARYWIKVFNQ